MTATETAPVPTGIPTPIGLDHLIEIRQETFGPKIVIAGHGIRVEKVGQWHEDCGMAVEDILEGYPELSREKIHAALAYYYANRVSMRAKLAAEDKFVEEMKAKAPPSPIQSLLDRLRNEDISVEQLVKEHQAKAN